MKNISNDLNGSTIKEKLHGYRKNISDLISQVSFLENKFPDYGQYLKDEKNKLETLLNKLDERMIEEEPDKVKKNFMEYLSTNYVEKDNSSYQEAWYKLEPKEDFDITSDDDIEEEIFFDTMSDDNIENKTVDITEIEDDIKEYIDALNEGISIFRNENEDISSRLKTLKFFDQHNKNISYLINRLPDGNQKDELEKIISINLDKELIKNIIKEYIDTLNKCVSTFSNGSENVTLRLNAAEFFDQQKETIGYLINRLSDGNQKDELKKFISINPYDITENDEDIDKSKVNKYIDKLNGYISTFINENENMSNRSKAWKLFTQEKETISWLIDSLSDGNQKDELKKFINIDLNEEFNKINPPKKTSTKDGESMSNISLMSDISSISNVSLVSDASSFSIINEEKKEEVSQNKSSLREKLKKLVKKLVKRVRKFFSKILHNKNISNDSLNKTGEDTLSINSISNDSLNKTDKDTLSVKIINTDENSVSKIKTASEQQNISYNGSHSQNYHKEIFSKDELDKITDLNTKKSFKTKIDDMKNRTNMVHEFRESINKIEGTYELTMQDNNVPNKTDTIQQKQVAKRSKHTSKNTMTQVRKNKGRTL